MNFKKTITAALVIAAMAGTVTPVAQNIAPAFNTTSLTAEAVVYQPISTPDMDTVWVEFDYYYFTKDRTAYSDRGLTKKNKKVSTIVAGDGRTLEEFYNFGSRICAVTEKGSCIIVGKQITKSKYGAKNPYELYVDANVYVKNQAYIRPHPYLEMDKNHMYYLWKVVLNSDEPALKVTYLSEDRNWGYVPKYKGWVNLADVRG